MKQPKTKKRIRTLKPKPAFSGRSLWVFVLIFAVVGSYIIWRSLAAPAPPTVYLTPASQTLGPSSTFTIQVRENSGTTPVNAIQANLTYPTAQLTFVSISSTGSAFPTVAQAAGAAGQVKIGAGVDTSSGTTIPVTGDQLVATITFTTTATSGAASVAFASGTVLVNASTNQDILGSLAATAGGTYTVDATPPTVSVTSPANGANVGAGSTTTVSVSASDSASLVAKVEIYVDGTLKTTDTTSPYNYSWNTAGLALGSTHTLQAKAYDTFNNVSTSSTNTVTIVDTTPPTTSITAPSANAFVKGSVAVATSTADNTGGSGISKAELYVDGVLKATSTISPYGFSWDSTTATNASHGLTVKAYDNASPANVTTSSAVSITVDNSAPNAPGNFASPSNTAISITLSWSAATDNNSVTGYQISRNGTVITTTGASSLSYTDTLLASGTSYSYSIVALDAAGNQSPPANLTASTQAAKPGDVNGDNKVDILDLSILLSHFGQTAAPNQGDINGDGSVTILDLSIMLTHYGS